LTAISTKLGGDGLEGIRNQIEHFSNADGLTDPAIDQGAVGCGMVSGHDEETRGVLDVNPVARFVPCACEPVVSA
jgi:hypothetical protein